MKLNHISFERDVVEIINSKGKKDRDLPLPGSLKQMIMSYLLKVNPKIWLIEGQKPETKYSTTSLENIFKTNLARVTKNDSFTLHCLRHSGVYPAFCGTTHLLDMGVDLRIIQELLGHKSSRITEIYPVGYDHINHHSSINILLSNGVNTHVSMKNLKNVKNPLDQFGGIA